MAGAAPGLRPPADGDEGGGGGAGGGVVAEAGGHHARAEHGLDVVHPLRRVLPLEENTAELESGRNKTRHKDMQQTMAAATPERSIDSTLCLF